MGIYINLRGVGAHKIAFLQSKYPTVTRQQFRNHMPGEGNKVGVAAVSNGPFDAVGVALSKYEIDAFTSETDRRPAFYFILDLDQVQELDPLAYANTVNALSK